MSKLRTITGTFRTLLALAKEEFEEMDHKLFRISIGVIVFIISALIWFYIFRGISPFGF
jgi:hypothetical protein